MTKVQILFNFSHFSFFFYINQFKNVRIHLLFMLCFSGNFLYQCLVYLKYYYFVIPNVPQEFIEMKKKLNFDKETSAFHLNLKQDKKKRDCLNLKEFTIIN